MSSLPQPQKPTPAGGPPSEYRKLPVKRITENLEKPSIDNRSYRVVELANQLEVLLIHDEEASTASASMNAKVGSFSDPAALPGLAHALEHMLFLGTKKYPLENDLLTYLSAHSGLYTAYTYDTYTNYNFHVAAEPAQSLIEASPFYSALDRFAQFFIEPLFRASSVDKELHAVESEFKLYSKNDEWRLGQLNRWLSNPKHPYSNFGLGSLQTLKILPESKGTDVRQEFMKFYDTHYSANRMKLVVLGIEPLDTLEEWVAELFSGVEDKNLPQLRWEAEQPFREEELLTQCFAKPVMDIRLLNLQFPFSEGEQLHGIQAYRYLTHLICSEGHGSILSYLRTKGWANSMSMTRDQLICPGTPGIFECQFVLTESGVAQYKEVLKVFFQYISLLYETTPQRWIFEEQKQMAEIDFKFKEQTSAMGFTTGMSNVMHHLLPREWLLSGQHLLREFDPNMIQNALCYLRPDNFRMTLISQNFHGEWNETEPQYGTEYKYEKIPTDFLVEMEQAASTTSRDRMPELHLPSKNPYIPTNLEVVKQHVKTPEVSPKLIRNDELIRTWFKKDDKFWAPKVDLFIKLRNPLYGATVENEVKTRIYDYLVTDALNECAHDAELGGLAFTLSTKHNEVQIELSGYNHKLTVLLEKVLTTMRDLVIEKDAFSKVTDKNLRRSRNFERYTPWYQFYDLHKLVTEDKNYGHDQYLEVVPRLSAEDIQLFYPQLLQPMHIEILAHGNLYKEDALRLTTLIENTIRPCPLPVAEWPATRSVVLPPSCNFVYRRTLQDPTNVNQGVHYLLQIGNRTDRLLLVKAHLLSQMTGQPFFNQIRTKEQLGYAVDSYFSVGPALVYCCYVVQGEKTPEYIETRIEAFFDDFEQTLRDMPESEFEEHKRSLITQCIQKPRSIAGESKRLWGQIEDRYCDFEQASHKIASIKPLTKADMIDFVKLHVSPFSPVRAKMSIHLCALGNSSTDKASASDLLATGVSDMVLGSDVAQETTTIPKIRPCVIEDIRAFKATLGLSALPKPVRDFAEFEDLE